MSQEAEALERMQRHWQRFPRDITNRFEVFASGYGIGAADERARDLVPCWCCSGPAKVVGVSQMDDHERWYLQPLCSRCEVKKRGAEASQTEETRG